MAKIKTTGLVLRENPVGEQNRMLDILTLDSGLISAVAYGAGNMKSAKTAGTKLFCYSELLLTEDKGRYTVDSAVPIDTFFAISESATRLAAASYFAQVLAECADTGTSEPDILRLALNTLYALTKKNERIVKAAFELRILALAGLEPQLDNCFMCGRKGDVFSFVEGCLCCERCAQDGQKLDDTTIAAMRYVLTCDPKRLFAFELQGKALDRFAYVCQKYLTTQLDRSFSALEIYSCLTAGEL